MDSQGFLLDEHIPHAIARGLRRREPILRVFVIGGQGAPLIGTLDPELLCWIEDNDCFLVTNNRSTMAEHLVIHLSAKRHVPGILIIPRRMSLREAIDELILIWAASLPGEFQDQIIYLPLRP